MIFDVTKRFLRDVLLPTVIAVVLSTVVITITALAFVGITVIVLLMVQKLSPTALPYIAAIPAAMIGAIIIITPYMLMRIKWKSESWKDAMIRGYVPWSALSMGIYALFSF
ncbi:MAG: hypothetical protein OXL37_04570 [Chloroflexota bacterium]|nr:hypothetical protein [Chloroflexota bacterium]MDE2960985.1 hypothetical protein [Chloroflexota bacterium]